MILNSNGYSAVTNQDLREKKVYEYAKSKAKSISEKMRDEAEEEVGAESTENYNYLGENFRIRVFAFWEKIPHFEFKLEGYDFKGVEKRIHF